MSKLRWLGREGLLEDTSTNDKLLACIFCGLEDFIVHPSSNFPFCKGFLHLYDYIYIYVCLY